MRPRLALAVLVVALAGCGSSAGQPAPAAPAPVVVDTERGSLRLDPRARTLTLSDRRGVRIARVPAGVGPVGVAASGRWAWVTDRVGGALLVYALRPTLEPTRRLYLAGGPTAIRVDRGSGRLRVRLSAADAVAELPAHGRPHVLRVTAGPHDPGQR
jgi:hypothetical protein